MGGMAVMALGTALVAGCGDDDGGTGGDAGSSTGGKAGSSSGGKAGAAGSASTGGKAGGGSGGTDGGTGNPDPVGGQGGSDVDPPVGGEGGGSNTGEGGEGGGTEPVELEPISKVRQDVISAAKVHDLRGLRFSTAAPGKLWAAGHKGINANPTPVGDPDKQLVIARFKADGTPDETFSEDGFLEVNLVEREEADDPNTVETTVVVLNDGNEEALGIVELEGGDIVVSGNKRDADGKGMDAYLARFTSAGVAVDEFGTDGVAVVTFGWGPADVYTPPTPTSPAAPSDNSWGVELDGSGDDDKLVVFGAGTAAKVATGTQRTDNDRYITRVLASTGEIDPAFNAGKPFIYNTGGTNGDNGRRGIVEADGSILAAGYTNFAPGGNHIVAIRLKPDGTRDGAFGPVANNRGVFHSNPVLNDGGVAECYNLVRQSSGRIVTTGYGSATAADIMSSFGYLSTKAPDLVSFAYSADGKTLDSDWGNLGMFIAQSEDLNVTRFEERGRDLAVLHDDRLVHAGNFATDPAIYVVNPDGSFDDDTGLFRYTPLTTTPTSSGGVSTSHFFRVVVSPDGKSIAASTNQNVDGVLVAFLKVGE